MVAIGIGLGWLAYFGGFYGYCLVRGYNVTPKQLLSTTWPPVSFATPGTGPSQAQGGSGFPSPGNSGGSSGGGAGGGGGGSF